MEELEKRELVENQTDTTEAAMSDGDASEAGVPDTALDITMGDMETDLPEVVRADAPAAAEPETEIPWGELETPSKADDESKEPESEPELEIPWGELEDAAKAESETEEGEDEREEAAASGVAAPTAEAGSEEPLPIKRVWYVVHCYSGYENKVKKGLEQRINSMDLQDYIFRVVVPVEREVEIREGQRKNIERRLFAGYILVEMMELMDREKLSPNASEQELKLAAKSDDVWYTVRNTPGVTGFVSSGDQQRPVPLREEEVQKILKRMESEEPKVHVTFRVGQTVHIIDGPFADFRGSVDAVDMTKGKVRVLVSFFGRETPVELDLLGVEKV